MAKLKDILKKIAGIVDSGELNELADNNSFDLEVDDQISDAITGKFGGLMTLDAAVNNNDVVEKVKSTLHKTLKKSILGNVDTAILDHAKKIFGDDAHSELEGIENTTERLNKFMGLSQDFIKRHSKDPKLQEVVDQMKGQIDGLNKQLAKSKEDSTNEITKLRTGIGDKLVNSQLKTILSNYKLAEDFTKQDFIKNALFEKIIGEVKKEAKLQFDFDSESVKILNPENPELPLYKDNKVVEDLSILVEPKIREFTAKQPGQRKTEKDYKPADPIENQSAQMQELAKQRANAGMVN